MFAGQVCLWFNSSPILCFVTTCHHTNRNNSRHEPLLRIHMPLYQPKTKEGKDLARWYIHLHSLLLLRNQLLL
ncbi:hypothetical protein F5H01DRAFT_153234 [Linnemannia elongata]|nr:hypothetical protein F5H01DRAFT_153234 [Linnemannia elongata]